MTTFASRRPIPARWMKIVLHSEVLLGMEQLLIAFVQRVGWAQELLKENCGERKALWCARRRIPLPRGMTRRLRHGSRACSSMGRSHFSFDGERKVCKRKPAARHYGKKPFIAHFDGGARNVARNFVGELPPTFARAPVLPFFRRQNGRAFFPSLPNAALLPHSWHRADSNSGAWELQRSLAASQRRETDLIFSFTVGARHA